MRPAPLLTRLVAALCDGVLVISLFTLLQFFMTKDFFSLGDRSGKNIPLFLLSAFLVVTLPSMFFKTTLAKRSLRLKILPTKAYSKSFLPYLFIFFKYSLLSFLALLANGEFILLLLLVSSFLFASKTPFDLLFFLKVVKQQNDSAHDSSSSRSDQSLVLSLSSLENNPSSLKDSSPKESSATNPVIKNSNTKSFDATV